MIDLPSDIKPSTCLRDNSTSERPACFVKDMASQLGHSYVTGIEIGVLNDLTATLKRQEDALNVNIYTAGPFDSARPRVLPTPRFG